MSQKPVTSSKPNSTTIEQILSPSYSLNKTAQELEDFKHLDFSSIPDESVQQAYQNALPPDAALWNLSDNNITQILEALAQFRRLPKFFECLSQDENIPLEIRNYIADKLAIKKPQDNQASRDLVSHQKDKIKSYIMATLTPCLPDNSNQFLLNAWLIIDDSLEGLSKFQSLLDENELQNGRLCKLTEITTEIDQFISKARRYLRGKKYCLTLEFFLPSHLMCMEVDRWKITNPIAEEISLGTQYPIRLRSLERLHLEYIDHYLSQWYEYWDKVRDILDKKPIQESFETLEVLESFNWKQLKNKLKQKIGLKVTRAHPQSIRKDLFRAILQATTPIAIWTRSDIPNLDQVTAINEILTFKPLCDLSEYIRENREKADAETEENLGLHLAILWENPYRLTPDIMVQLIPPGS